MRPEHYVDLQVDQNLEGQIHFYRSDAEQVDHILGTLNVFIGSMVPHEDDDRLGYYEVKRVGVPGQKDPSLTDIRSRFSAAGYELHGSGDI